MNICCGCQGDRSINPQFEYPGSDIEGWMTPTELEWLYQTARRVNSIVEVGSFLGRSTHALLSGCSGKVIAVDDFSTICSVIGMNINKNELIKTFANNLKGFPNLEVFVGDSLEAAKVLPDVDMVFLDGNHDYEPLCKELDVWLPKTKRVLCGHDYNEVYWPGVAQAVDEKFGDRVNVLDHIWFITL